MQLCSVRPFSRGMVLALTLACLSVMPMAYAQPPANKPAAKPANKPAAKPGSKPTTNPQPTQPVAPFAGNTTREFTIDFKSYNDKTMTYGGDVTITSLETQLKAPTLIFDRKAQTAVCSEKIQFDDVQQTLMGNKGSVDYRMQEAKLEGGVTVMLRSTPESGKKDLGTISCEMATYNWRDRMVTATGNVVLKLKNRTITAEKVEFFGKEEKVIFTGAVVITADSGDVMKCGKATLVLKEGVEEMTVEEGKNATFKITDGQPG